LSAPVPQTELWLRARRVRDRIERRLRARRDVRLIDIGASSAGLPVIQIQVDRHLTLADLGIDSQVDGIPIQVTRAAPYRPE
jgi:hypothetical protein